MSSAAAVQRGAEPRSLPIVPFLRSVGTSALVLAVFWAVWEAYKWIGERTEISWPFEVNERTMPHIHEMIGQLFEPSRRNGPLLIDVLLDAALFTAKEAAAGFLLGAVVGFAIAVCLSEWRLLQRGFLPYIIASQTIPILAIAPMVVVWVNPRLPESLAGWGAVAVISAYLTFFPVAINTLRGLTSADPRAVELMRSYAASRWSILWKLRVPVVDAVPVHRPEDLGAGGGRGRDHRRAAVLDPGRARRRDPQLQPVLRDLAAEPLGDEHHRSAAGDPLLRGRRRSRSGSSCGARRRTSHELSRPRFRYRGCRSGSSGGTCSRSTRSTSTSRRASSSR